jgi:hypothetical protein
MRPMKVRKPGSSHDALARLMTQIGESRGAGDGVQLAADFEGKTRFTFYKLLDPDQDGEMSYARVARLTEHFRVPAAAEHLASLCGAILVMPPDAELTGDPIDRISAEALKEISDMFSALAQARADGSIDLVDAALILPEIRSAMSKLAALEHQVVAEAGSDK